MLERVRDTGYSGMYLRVMKEGNVAAGDPVELLKRPAGAPTVAHLNYIRYHDTTNLEAARRILAAEGLAKPGAAVCREN